MSRWAMNQGYIACYTRGGTTTPPCQGYLLQGNEDRLLQGNGFGVLYNYPCPAGALLQGNGDFLLQGNEFKILYS